MHLVPADRAHRHPIDDHQVCAAVEAVGDPQTVAAWAARFALVSDPGRLTLLLAMQRVGPIAVSDLAIATGINDAAVSQSLRLLRAAGAVHAERDGRVVRYSVVDPVLATVLAGVPGSGPGPDPASGAPTTTG